MTKAASARTKRVANGPSGIATGRYANGEWQAYAPGRFQMLAYGMPGYSFNSAVSPLYKSFATLRLNVVQEFLNVHRTLQ